jgi:hypothetical protein
MLQQYNKKSFLYNYFHYKYFDNCGEEVSKLNQYTKNIIKIKLFHERRNEKNSITSFSNNEKKIILLL